MTGNTITVFSCLTMLMLGCNSKNISDYNPNEIALIYNNQVKQYLKDSLGYFVDEIEWQKQNKTIITSTIDSDKNIFAITYHLPHQQDKLIYIPSKDITVSYRYNATKWIRQAKDSTIYLKSEYMIYNKYNQIEKSAYSLVPDSKNNSPELNYESSYFYNNLKQLVEVKTKSPYNSIPVRITYLHNKKGEITQKELFYNGYQLDKEVYIYFYQYISLENNYSIKMTYSKIKQNNSHQ